MSKEPNANCLVCGKPYYVCRDCNGINSWRRAACCPEHFQIRQVYLSHRDGELTDEQAKQGLQYIGVTSGDNLNEGYRQWVNNLFAPIVEYEEFIYEEPVVVTKKSSKKTKG